MTTAPKLEPTLHVAAQRLMDIARRIEKASSEDEENDLCDQRDKLLAMFRAADSAAPSAGLREDNVLTPRADRAVTNNWQLVKAAATEIWHARSDHFGEADKAFVRDERWELCVSYARAAIPLIVAECAKVADEFRPPYPDASEFAKGANHAARMIWAAITELKAPSKDRGEARALTLSKERGGSLRADDGAPPKA